VVVDSPGALNETIAQTTNTRTTVTAIAVEMGAHQESANDRAGGTLSRRLASRTGSGSSRHLSVISILPTALRHRLPNPSSCISSAAAGPMPPVNCGGFLRTDAPRGRSFSSRQPRPHGETDAYHNGYDRNNAECQYKFPFGGRLAESILRQHRLAPEFAERDVGHWPHQHPALNDHRSSDAKA